MMPTRKLIWTAAGVSAAAAIAARLLPFHPAHHLSEASAAHAHSFAASVLTPSPSRGLQERYTASIPVRRLRDGVITDEEILARFARGFFSGLAFAPEKLLLVATPLVLTDIPSIQSNLALRSKEEDTSSFSSSQKKQLAITNVSYIPPTSTSTSSAPLLPPPVGSFLFHAFLVLDSSSINPAHRAQLLPAGYDEHQRPPHAFVEMAYGGAGLGLVGTHRFEVSRRGRGSDDIERSGEGGKGGEEGKEREEELVDITFSAVCCRTSTGLAPPRWLLWFHVLYSRLLFSDGIRGVLEG
ncbi:hypothetical protein F4778DRAFT_238247 [Xylariomycetidae sp. FL2044]|nr:hypothetical protein F4778DRAFT_238247 [Xylariomycetidae sp. FL2044]